MGAPPPPPPPLLQAAPAPLAASAYTLVMRCTTSQHWLHWHTASWMTLTDFQAVAANGKNRRAATASTARIPPSLPSIPLCMPLAGRCSLLRKISKSILDQLPELLSIHLAIGGLQLLQQYQSSAHLRVHPFICMHSCRCWCSRCSWSSDAFLHIESLVVLPCLCSVTLASLTSLALAG